MSERLRVAYAIQNVGIDLATQVGDAVPVRYTLHGLQKAGYEVGLFQLNGRAVLGANDVSNLNQVWHAPTGMSGTRPFQLVESGIRRLQRQLRLPYFAFFDSFRFYEAMAGRLPAYHLCHEHNGLFSIGAALACKKLNKPYVLTFSADAILESALVGKPLRGVHGRIAAWEARFTYKTARQILCVSTAAKEHLINKWGVDAAKINVMPNGVDVALFGQPAGQTAVRAQLGLPHAPIIMFVGGFQLWHGLDLLVESFAQVVQKMPGARLLLVGDGVARPVIEQQAHELGVSDSVVITGLVPHEHVPAFLAAADVVTLPYPRLPQKLWFSPLKLYEYMAAGKAIVASRAGQIADVLEHSHTGLLVEPGNVYDLAQAICGLLQNAGLREKLGQNARAQAAAQHSWDRYVARLEEIYARAMEA